MHGQQNVRISLFVVYSGPVYSNKWYVFVQKLDKLIYKNVIRLHNSAMSRQVFYEAKQNYGWFCIFFLTITSMLMAEQDKISRGTPNFGTLQW